MRKLNEDPRNEALITLHYRIELEDGSEVLSTYGGNLATLSLGSGELAPALERCLAQAEEGKTCVFLLQAGEAFGERREELVTTMQREEFPGGMKVEEGTLIKFSEANGGSHAGLVRSIENGAVCVDFNHPLAGRAVRFEVKILSIL